MAPISYITRELARRLDGALMSEPYAYRLEQLMELAGLSVASVVVRQHGQQLRAMGTRGILCVAGPGNNGGDGLVACRHLKMFGYEPWVWTPAKIAPRLAHLRAQCETLGIPVFAGPWASFEAPPVDLVIDAIFGFSYRPGPGGAIGPPFDEAVERVKAMSCPLVSVDVPTGWDVELGDVHGVGLHPSTLVSLGLPKLCAKSFEGHHWLGGRFLPPSLLKDLGVSLGPDAYMGVGEVQAWKINSVRA